MRYSASYIFPFFILLHVHSEEIGEKCSLPSGSTGTCLIIDDCHDAIENLRNNVQPISCGFSEDKPKVCCQYPHRRYQTVRTHCLPDPDHSDDNAGVGGIDAEAAEFPHMSALGYEDGDDIVWGCGGTLISSDFVMTAAHCLHSKELGPVKHIRLGDLNLRRTDDVARPQNFTVKKTFKHPDYHPPIQYNDIALVQLDRVAQLDEFVQPACLNDNPNRSPSNLIATGWGRLGYYAELADHLQKMLINAVPKEACQKRYRKQKTRKLPNGIVDSQMCAGAPRIDTCAGDSGGPLQSARRNGYLIYGVTSFGVACGITSTPGVYTRVATYIDWIDSIVWPKGDNHYQYLKKFLI